MPEPAGPPGGAATLVRAAVLEDPGEAPAPAGADARLAAAVAGLGQLAGFAPNPVLFRRMARSAALLPRLDLARPSIEDPGWASLLDAVTVQETRLFRHPESLRDLAGAVLPRLAAGRPGARLLLVSAGCATGEEAFTLAMLAARAGVRFGVLGLDLSRPALAAAAAACFGPGPPDPARDVPADYHALLERTAAGLRPVASLRAAVGFLRANLLAPPPLGQPDLVMCRNVLMYLGLSARARVLAGLVGQLRPGGALVLGPTDAPPPGLPLLPWGGGAAGVWRRQHGDG